MSRLCKQTIRTISKLQYCCYQRVKHNIASVFTTNKGQDPCASKPCLNGATCVRQSAFTYQCNCAKTYIGTYCELHEGTTRYYIRQSYKYYLMVEHGPVFRFVVRQYSHPSNMGQQGHDKSSLWHDYIINAQETTLARTHHASTAVLAPPCHRPLTSARAPVVTRV